MLDVTICVSEEMHCVSVINSVSQDLMTSSYLTDSECNVVTESSFVKHEEFSIFCNLLRANYWSLMEFGSPVIIYNIEHGNGKLISENVLTRIIYL